MCGFDPPMDTPCRTTGVAPSCDPPQVGVTSRTRMTSEEPGMFARKLGRVAGLVLVLAVVFGGVGVAAGGAAETHTATQFSTLVSDWE